MGPGSIVVCKKCPMGGPGIEWLPEMNEETTYELRDLEPASNAPEAIMVTFQEGVIGRTKDGEEIGFPADYCIELLPPQEVSIEDIITELV